MDISSGCLSGGFVRTADLAAKVERHPVMQIRPMRVDDIPAVHAIILALGAHHGDLDADVTACRLMPRCCRLKKLSMGSVGSTSIICMWLRVCAGAASGVNWLIRPPMSGAHWDAPTCSLVKPLTTSSPKTLLPVGSRVGRMVARVFVSLFHSKDGLKPILRPPPV